MADVVLWQYRWLNPAGDTNVTPGMLAWKEVQPWTRIQTIEQRLQELRDFRYQGKPAYEVRALGVIAHGVDVPPASACRKLEMHGDCQCEVRCARAAGVTGWRPPTDSDGEKVTPERLIAWLEAKYRRHGEEEDKWAADYIRALGVKEVGRG